MKKNKKPKWLSCVLLLLKAVSALSRKKGKKEKEVIYKLTFTPREKSGKKTMTTKEISKQISAMIKQYGCPFTEYKAYETGKKKDSFCGVTFFLIRLQNEQVAALVQEITEALPFLIGTISKEEQAYIGQ